MPNPSSRRGRHRAPRTITRRARLVAVILGTLAVLGGNLTANAGDPARAPYGSGTINPGWINNTPSVSSTLTFERVRDNNGVLLVGDSIARATQLELATRMWDDHGLFTAVNTWPGRPTTACVDALEGVEQYIPQRGLVMACGANDIFDPVDFWQQVDRVLDIADGKPVYWVTVHVERWSGSTERRVADQRNSAWINQQLYAMALAHPNLKPVDWAAAVAAGPNEARVEAWLTDGVHPTDPSGVYGWCNTLQNKMGL